MCIILYFSHKSHKYVVFIGFSDSLTTIYTHADEVPQNGTASAFCFSKTLLKLLSVSREREEVNNYLYKMGIILTYLPHLEILGSMGRPETYNKS
jgi:hypothetical protein